MGLTPPSALLPLPVTPTHGEGPLSEQSHRGLSPVTSSWPKSRVFKDMPLNSSPPSHMATRPLPSPTNPSPLSSDLQNAQIHLSTTPESIGSPPPSSPQPDWLERPLHPLFLQTSSSSSSNNASLLLEQVHLTSSSPPSHESAGRIARVGSTSTGSGHGGLLDAVARDSQLVLRRAADGAVEAGTLEGLVDRLVTETHDRAKDDEVQRVFITAYRLFTTGEDLFSILKRRFDEMGDVLRFSNTRVSIRYS
jgi:hypothetical protein